MEITLYSATILQPGIGNKIVNAFSLTNLAALIDKALSDCNYTQLKEWFIYYDFLNADYDTTSAKDATGNMSIHIRNNTAYIILQEPATEIIITTSKIDSPIRLGAGFDKISGKINLSNVEYDENKYTHKVCGYYIDNDSKHQKITLFETESLQLATWLNKMLLLTIIPKLKK